MDIRVFSGDADDDQLDNVVVAQLDVPDVEALGDAGCRAILEAVLGHLAQSPLRPDNAPGSWTFALVEDDEMVMLEHAIYQQAALFPELHELIHALVRATAVGAHRHRAWADDETPTGAAGASSLALQARRWIPAYLQYLRECDLDHEVHQGAELDAIVQTHGWNDDTIALAVARLTCCCGQFGEEQVEEWYEEQGLDECLASDHGREAFLAEARRVLGQPPTGGRGRLDRATGARVWTEEDLESQLELFEAYLVEDDLEELRQHALAAAGLGD